MENKTAYPLCWPARRPRTSSFERRTNNNFRQTFAAAREICKDEVRRLGGSDIIISSNINLKKDGEPMAVKFGVVIPDGGVAVYFKRKGKDLCFACDRWNHVQDNMYAIALTIEALRGVARWGTGDMMEAAFTGFMALPEKSSASYSSPYELLGVPADASIDQIREAYKKMAKLYHPDAGGSADAFIAIKDAYDKLERAA